MSAGLLLFVGTLNRETPYFQGARGDGLHVFTFDEARLSFAPVAHFPGIDNPTFLSVTPDGRHVYANSEVAEWREGLVTALHVDAAAGRLGYLNTQATLGSITAHNAISHDGKRLFVVNYTVGDDGPDRTLVIYDIGVGGSLSPPCGAVSHRGGPRAHDRQDRAHGHSVVELPDGRLIVADLGMDALVSYRLSQTGQPEQIALTPMRTGAGPRHMALAPGGGFLFVISELDSRISAWRVGPGAFEEVSNVPALPAGCDQVSHCSDIALSADGRFLYGANRGHDSIVQIAVDPATGGLEVIGHIPCGGQTPRNLALTPSGRHLMVANQNADRVSVLARDPASGRLTDTGQHLAIGTPMCLKFAVSG